MAAAVDSINVTEASTVAVSLYMQSIGIPGDPGLCRAQNSQDGNMAFEIGECSASSFLITGALLPNDVQAPPPPPRDTP